LCQCFSNSWAASTVFFEVNHHLPLYYPHRIVSSSSSSRLPVPTDSNSSANNHQSSTSPTPSESPSPSPAALFPL
jgi:hypothetical protein